MNTPLRKYSQSVYLPVTPEILFAYIDDHAQLSAHMSQPSWMMGGGSMSTEVDEGRGQAIGSHIRLRGKVVGISIFLDEVITEYLPPYRKVWKTVGTPQLLVIGHYTLGVEVVPQNEGSQLTVFIEYELPESFRTRWLGYLLGRMYARWCVQQMVDGAQKKFAGYASE